MTFTLVSRGGWGARPPRSAVATKAVETFGHHSANDHRGAVGVRAIQNFHMDVRGWSDIAYNFLIDRRTLVVYEGRGWRVRPGSQFGYNTGTWSVCVLGDFRSVVPTQGLLDTIAELIRHGAALGHIPRVLTGGHKDAPGQNTSCPGPNLHSRIPIIRTLLEGDMPLSEADILLIRQAIRDESPAAVLGAAFGGPPGSPSRKSLALHILEIKGLAATPSPVNEAGIAQAVVAAMSPGLRAAVAAELANLKLEATQ